MRFNPIRSICFLALGLFGEHVAISASFFNDGASARSAGLGGAYLPADQSALDAMAINPAGLALLNARTLDLNFEGLFARGQFTNSVNKDGRIEGTAGLVPFGAFGAPIGSSRFTFGAGAMPELMNAAKWRYADAPGVGGASYGLQDNQAAILALRTAVGMGVYLGPRLSIGATFGAVYNSNTLQTPYVFQNHPALAGLKTLLDLHTNGIGYNGSFGVLARPTKRLQAGLAYKSRTTITSTGHATGNAANQFAALGIPFRPDFRYTAEVDNVLPQSLTANLIWEATRRLRLVAQADWIDWRRAFTSLPVKLTNGTNSDINGLLASSSLADSIPLHWKDQVVSRVGVERLVAENGVFRAGYAHTNSPVPNSTLTPLTAAITGNTLSAGAGYRHGRYRLDLAYALDLTAQQSVQQSALKSGEYNNSRVKVGTQSVSLSTSIWF
jgi:long-chain fatty acid transport protein